MHLLAAGTFSESIDLESFKIYLLSILKILRDMHPRHFPPHLASPFASEAGEGRRGHGGPGGRRGRMFDGGDLKLLVLQVLSRQPSHGYEVIKAIGEQVGGDYSPSPGTIYPLLTMLEDLGLAEAAATEGSRRQYALTEAGRAHLAEQAEALARIEARLAHTRDQARARRVPDIQRAMENLKTALRLRFDGDTPPDEATVRQIAEAIDRAAVEIGRL